MLKKLTGMNYFVSLVILLGITLTLGLAAFILVASIPGALGAAPPHDEVKEIYDFEPWSFEIDGLAASYPEGGIAIPIYRHDKQDAVLLMGRGDYRVPDQNLPPEEAAGLYLDIDFDRFSEIRGDVIFMPVEDEAARNRALNIYARQPGLPVQWQQGIPLVFYPGEYALFYHFVDANGAPLMPPAIIAPAIYLFGTVALYTLFMAMILLTVLIFSLDHHPSRYWTFIHCARPGWPVAAAAVGAAAFALLGELLPHLTNLGESAIALGYTAAIGGLILLARLRRVDFLDFGLRPDTARHGYLMVAAAAVLFMVMTRGFPSQISINGFSALIDFLLLFLLVALTREMIWRGYIQTTLARLLGFGPGLILTAILAGLTHYALLTITAPWMTAYPYTLVETLVLVPGTALVLGFIYLRTENILAGTLLHCFILFLPRIITG